ACSCAAPLFEATWLLEETSPPNRTRSSRAERFLVALMSRRRRGWWSSLRTLIQLHQVQGRCSRTHMGRYPLVPTKPLLFTRGAIRSNRSEWSPSPSSSSTTRTATSLSTFEVKRWRCGVLFSEQTRPYITCCGVTPERNELPSRLDLTAIL